MATTSSYVEYFCEQIRASGTVRFKKMFGEYMVYVNDKPLFLVCDNAVFVKKHEVLADLMRDEAPTGFPYQGAKEHYNIDPDNAALCADIIALLEPVTPIPKRKPKREKRLQESKTQTGQFCKTKQEGIIGD